MTTGRFNSTRGGCTRRGSALTLSLITVVTVAMLGAAVVSVTASGTAQDMLSADRMKALYTAEAGLSEAFLAVAQGRSGNVASATIPAVYAGGVYWVEATPQVNDRVRLEAHGLHGVGRFSLGATIDRRVHPLGALGLASFADIAVGSGSSAAGSDSGAQPGGGDAEGVPIMAFPPAGRISTNGDIFIGAATNVDGELRHGPDGLAVLDPSAIVTGDLRAAAREFYWPNVMPPSFMGVTVQAPIGDVSVDVGHGRQYFQNIDVQANQTVRFVGPNTVVTRSLTIAERGTLEFDTEDGAVELYVVGASTFESGSFLKSAAGQSASVGLFLYPPPPDPPGAGGEGGEGGGLTGGLGSPGGGVLAELPELHLNSTGTFHGMLYAVGYEVHLGPNLAFHGSLAGGRVELEPGTTFTHDIATRTAGLGVPALPRQEGWYVIAVPDLPITKQRNDPLDYLASIGVTPVRTPIAANEQDLVLDYVDPAGVARTYSGPANLVDWVSVEGVTDLAWVDGVSGLTVEYDDGLGTLNPVPDIVKTTIELNEDEVIGGIRTSVQMLLDEWPTEEMELQLQMGLLCPLSSAEISAVQGLLPPPSAELLINLEQMHLDKGGAPW